jgi:hypothetical protein
MYENTMVLVNFTCGKQGCEFFSLWALGVGNTQPAASTTQDKKGIGQSSADSFSGFTGRC